MNARHLTATVAVLSAGGFATAAVPALAAPPIHSKGAHVSECAHSAAGKRTSPPTVTCVHDGHTHTFANFGALVEHVRGHHSH